MDNKYYYSERAHGELYIEKLRRPASGGAKVPHPGDCKIIN